MTKKYIFTIALFVLPVLSFASTYVPPAKGTTTTSTTTKPVTTSTTTVITSTTVTNPGAVINDTVANPQGSSQVVSVTTTTEDVNVFQRFWHWLKALFSHRDSENDTAPATSY